VSQSFKIKEQREKVNVIPYEGKWKEALYCTNGKVKTVIRMEGIHFVNL